MRSGYPFYPARTRVTTMNLKSALFLYCLCVAIGEVRAAVPETLRVRYVRTVLPDVSVYFDLRDTTHQPADTPQLNQLTLTVGASPAVQQAVVPFAQANEGVAYIFLVDISKSLKSEQFAQMQAALTSWIDALSEKDRAALMTFGADVKLAQDFTGDKETLQQAVNGLAPTDNLTQLHHGFVRALELGKRADADLSPYRVIVTLSDGQDDFPGGVTYQEVLDRLKEDPIPMYALGFFPASLTAKEKDALRALGTVARASGGEYLEATGDQIEAQYLSLRQRIRQVFVARFSCPVCVADGQARRVQLIHTAGTKTLTDGLSVRLLPRVVPLSPPIAQSPRATAPGATEASEWLYPVTGIVIALVVAGAAFFFRWRNPESTIEASEPAMPLVAQPPATTPVREPVWGRLTVIGSAKTRKAYNVGSGKQVVIGRNPTECTVVIADDPEISARHCLLVREQGAVFVRDLESRTGTLVNGVPIVGRHKLSEDDVLLLGRTKLRFSRSDEADV